MLTNRKILSLLLLTGSVCYASAQPVTKTAGKNVYTVSGKLEALQDGKIYLAAIDGAGKIDSVLAKNGRFTFKGVITEPMFYVLRLPGQNGGKGFFLEPGNIRITGHKDSLYNATVEGSGSQKEFEEWGKTWRGITAQAGPFYR
ncbi:MAG TPA: DUF4369 domain-containing protein, partial [Chitinophagaceae bacterium]|nr:DUF4369 domain-containing protein [Chitinophagaceae bacterium]